MREREFAFGAAEKIVGVLGGVRLHKRLRVGEADVLHRHAHHAPREVKRRLAAVDHAAEPVKRRVGVGAAHRLVQRADEVVMAVAVLVVERRAALHEGGKLFRLDGLRAVMRGGEHILGEIEHGAAVAVRHADQRPPARPPSAAAPCQARPPRASKAAPNPHR